MAKIFNGLKWSEGIDKWLRRRTPVLKVHSLNPAMTFSKLPFFPQIRLNLTNPLGTFFSSHFSFFSLLSVLLALFPRLFLNIWAIFVNVFFFFPKNGHKFWFMNCTPLLFGRKTPFPPFKRQNSAKVYKIRNQNQAILRQIHAFPNTLASRFSRQTLFSLKNGARKQAGRAKRRFSGP